MLEQINYTFQKNFGSSWTTEMTLNVSYPLYPIIRYGFMDVDNDGNLYFAPSISQSYTLVDNYIMSVDNNGIPRYCKLIKDIATGQTAIGQLNTVQTDKNNRIHVCGFKNAHPYGTYSSDIFYIIFNQDGSTYKNLAYTDNPTSGWIAGMGCEVSKNYAVCYGNKWSSSYSANKPFIFVHDLNGNLLKALYSNTATPINQLLHAFNIPNTDSFILINNSASNSNTLYIIQYNAITNTIEKHISLPFSEFNINSVSSLRICFDNTNNIYVIGYNITKNNICIVKLNSNYSVQWTKIFYQSGLKTNNYYMTGRCIINDFIYISVNNITNNFNNVILKINCLTGEIVKQWKNNLSNAFGQMVFKNNAIYTLDSDSKQTFIFSKINLDDLENNSNIEMKFKYNISQINNVYVCETILNPTITTQTNITFSTTNYNTNKLVSISDINITKQNKINGIYS